MSKHIEVRFTAVGGQGILLAGDILATAAIDFAGLYALDSPTYTAQVRGGPTKIDVIIDDTKILFPRTTAIDCILSLSQKSHDFFATDLKKDCKIIVDPILVHNVDDSYEVYRVPIIEMTKKEMHKMVYTSAVSLGAMIGITEILPVDIVRQALLKKAPRGTEDQNIKAFNLGYDAGLDLSNYN